IYDYMFANGILEKDVEQYNKEGYLANSTFSSVKEVTEENKYEAGEEIYKGQCLACHTVAGWREKRAFANRLDGWDEDGIDMYIESLHETRSFVPLFVGMDEERETLSHYLATVVEEKKAGERAQAKEGEQ